MNDEMVIERVVHVDTEILDCLKSFTEVDWNVEHLKTFISSSQNILLIARKGHDVCGAIRAHVLPRYDDKTAEILLHEIDVLPQYQKIGIATALIHELKRIAKESHVSEMWVVTNKSNEAAMALYNKTGGKIAHDDDVVFVYEKEQCEF
jgi:ribosomal protein S18 acetylase RimI-like enzyme